MLLYGLPCSPPAQETSMADGGDDYDQGKSGASDTYPAQCSSLRKGGHVMIKNKPCKIVEMSTSKTGKHGHAKVHLVALDIFNGKKLEDICPSTHNMNVPHVVRKDLQVSILFLLRVHVCATPSQRGCGEQLNCRSDYAMLHPAA